MGRPRRVGGFLLGTTLLLTALVGGAVELTPHPDPEECVVTGYGVYESSGNASEVPGVRRERYENLTDRQQALFERALAREGEQFSVTGTERRTAGRMPSVVDHENTTYRTTTRSNCPVVPGVPLALNPVLVPFAAAAVLLTGPLLPVTVLLLVLGLGSVVASRVEY